MSASVIKTSENMSLWQQFKFSNKPFRYLLNNIVCVIWKTNYSGSCSLIYATFCVIRDYFTIQEILFFQCMRRLKLIKLVFVIYWKSNLRFVVKMCAEKYTNFFAQGLVSTEKKWWQKWCIVWWSYEMTGLFLFLL